MSFGAPTKDKPAPGLVVGLGQGIEDEGDSAMSATVGYTTAAAVELILQLHKKDGSGEVAHSLAGRAGVLIPTTPDIYGPILKRLSDFGISWTESVTVTQKNR